MKTLLSVAVAAMLSASGAGISGAWAAGTGVGDGSDHSPEVNGAASKPPDRSSGGIGENGTMPNRQGAVSPTSNSGSTNASSGGTGVGIGANSGANTSRVPGGTGGGSGASNGGR